VGERGVFITLEAVRGECCSDCIREGGITTGVDGGERGYFSIRIGNDGMFIITDRIGPFEDVDAAGEGEGEFGETG